MVQEGSRACSVDCSVDGGPRQLPQVQQQGAGALHIPPPGLRKARQHSAIHHPASPGVRAGRREWVRGAHYLGRVL